MNFFIKNKLMIGLAIVTCLYVTNTNSGTESIPGLGGVKDVLKRVGNMGSELSQQELKPNYWKTGICAVLYGLSYYMEKKKVFGRLEKGLRVKDRDVGVILIGKSGAQYGLILLNGFINVLPGMVLDSLQTGNFVDKNVVLGLGPSMLGFVKGFLHNKTMWSHDKNDNVPSPLGYRNLGGRVQASAASTEWFVYAGIYFGCQLLGKSINFLRGNNKA